MIWFILMAVFGCTVVFVWESMFLWFLFEILLICMISILIKTRCSIGFLVMFFLLELFMSAFILLFMISDLASLGTLAIVGKFGLFPFWFWIIRAFEDTSFSVCFLLMWIYKIPLFVFFFESFSFYSIMFFVFINFFSSLALFFYFQSEEKQIALLVIFSTGWLLMASSIGVVVGISFFLLYGVLLFFLLSLRRFNMKQMSLFIFISLLFYFGVPPLPSFFMKLVILMACLEYSFMFSFMLFLSLVVFFCFIWVRFSSFFILVKVVFLFLFLFGSLFCLLF